MIYASTITYEKGGSEASEVRTVLKVSKGLVWRIEVESPSGCCGLVHVKILDGKYQMFPASIGETIASNGSVIGFDDLYLKTSGPFEFIIVGWNEDTRHSHKVQVRIGMASSEAFMSRYMPSLTWEKFHLAMAEAAAKQEAEREAQLALLKSEIRTDV